MMIKKPNSLKKQKKIPCSIESYVCEVQVFPISYLVERYGYIHDDEEIENFDIEGEDNKYDSFDVEQYIFSLTTKESIVLFLKSVGYQRDEIISIAELKSKHDYYRQCRTLKLKYDKSIMQ